jgi:hypothetical protein
MIVMSCHVTAEDGCLVSRSSGLGTTWQLCFWNMVTRLVALAKLCQPFGSMRLVQHRAGVKRKVALMGL